MSADIVLKLHLFGVAFWLGVVGVEFLLERRRADSREQGFQVAHLHKRIDLFLEMPAFTLVLVTGVLLLEYHSLSTLLMLKVVAGGAAIGGNLVCIVPVLARSNAADKQDLTGVVRYSRIIDWISVVAVPAGLIAFACGLWLMLSGWV